MEDRHEIHPEQRAIILTLAAWILETAGCTVMLLRIPSDSKNAFLFGLSKERLLMLAVFAVLFLCGILAFFIRDRLFSFLETRPRAGTVLGIIAVVTFFLVMLPDYRFGKKAAYFTRIRPFLLWAFLSSLTFSVSLRYVKDRFSGVRETLGNLSGNRKEITAVLLFLVFGVIFIEITGLGKTPESALWNKNGIPLQSIQLFGSVLIFLILKQTGIFSKTDRQRKTLHFFLIWAVSALIWSIVPIKDHFFAPGPYLPEMEYYPYSDAAGYDISAQTALNGWGFNLGRTVLKPTVVFMSFLSHLVTGNDYSRAMYVQSALYAILPAVIFLFGSAIGGTGCGYLAAAFSILKEWNALNAEIVLTIHSRLVMSEFLMQIILAAFCYAVFRWLKKDGGEIFYAVIAGGTLALGIFTRYNFLAFLPAVLLILVIGYKDRLRSLLKPLLFFLIALALTSAPMIIRESQLAWDFLSEISYTIQNQLFKTRYDITADEQTETEPDAVPEDEDPELSDEPSDDVPDPIPSEVAADELIEEPVMAAADSAAEPEILQESAVPAALSEEKSEIAPFSQENADLPGTSEAEFNTDEITKELTNNNSTIKLPLLISLFNHGMHNIISSALTLPMEPVFHDTEHLYKNEGDGLWRDSWQGDFSAKQWLLIAVWILLFSAGCGVLIRMHGIAGLSILYFWAVYAFSIGVSRSSGGRYIVPVNWIPMLLLAFICVLLGGKGSVETVQTESSSAPVRKAVFATTLFTAFFTSMILFELFMPARNTWGGKLDRLVLRDRLSGVVNVNWKKVRKQQKQGKLHITRGVVLYPRFYYFRVGEHGYYGSLGWKDYSRLAFTGINLNRRKKLLQEYLLPQQNFIEKFPQDSVFRAISCNSGNGYEDVLAVTIETPEGKVYTYVRSPLKEISCPVPEPVCDSIGNCR